MDRDDSFSFIFRFQNDFGDEIRQRKPHHLVKEDLKKLMEWKLTVRMISELLQYSQTIFYCLKSLQPASTRLGSKYLLLKTKS